MFPELEYNHLHKEQSPENTEDIGLDTSVLLDIGLTNKQLLDWYYHSNRQSIPEMLKNETSSPHTFVVNVRFVYDFYQCGIEPLLQVAQQLHRIMRSTLQLKYQELTTYFKIYFHLNKPNAKLSCRRVSGGQLERWVRLDC